MQKNLTICSKRFRKPRPFSKGVPIFGFFFGEIEKVGNLACVKHLTNSMGDLAVTVLGLHWTLLSCTGLY